MKRLEQYIPLAIDVVEDIFLKEESKVDPEFDNLVSQFGVAVRLLGLKTAVIAFSPKIEELDDQKPTDRKVKLTKAILRIIQLHEDSFNDKTLKDFILRYPANPLLKPKILDAAVALKLALRLYIENPKDEEVDDERDS
ncbi:MAG: hypothetical protein Q8J97_15075 [Flavobacteriaceae bacterium]|nr:hypothetical protein [Flavobacteriaceae bacterium]